MRAIRSSLAHAMTPIECLGIMERDGEVGLRIDAEGLPVTAEYTSFNVYDKISGQLRGRVRVVAVEGSVAICVVFHAVNEDFWAHLESRVRYDSTPPDVYLVWEERSDLAELAGQVFNHWR